MNSERTNAGWSSWLLWVLAVAVGSSLGTALAHDVTRSLLGSTSMAIEEIVHGAVVGVVTGGALIFILRRSTS